MQIIPDSITAPFYNALQLSDTCILEEDDRGLLLHTCGIYMLYHEDAKTGTLWLSSHLEPGSDAVIMVSSSTLADAISRHFPHLSRQECIQVQALDDSVFPENPVFVIRQASLEHFDFVHAHYQLVSGEELRQDIACGNLFLLCSTATNEIAGFGGIHKEGSMGLLEILPDYRRQGGALMMEGFLVEEMKRRHLVPFAHIFAWNQASLALQQKARMSFCSTPVYWFTPEEKTKE